MKTAELIKMELKVPKSKVRKIKTLVEKESVIAEIAAPELPKGMRKGNYK